MLILFSIKYPYIVRSLFLIFYCIITLNMTICTGESTDCFITTNPNYGRLVIDQSSEDIPQAPYVYTSSPWECGDPSKTVKTYNPVQKTWGIFRLKNDPLPFLPDDFINMSTEKVCVLFTVVYLVSFWCLASVDDPSKELPQMLWEALTFAPLFR